MSTILDKKAPKTTRPVCSKRYCRWAIPAVEAGQAIARGAEVGLTICVPDAKGFAVEVFYWVAGDVQWGTYTLTKPSPDNDGCTVYKVDLHARRPLCDCPDRRYRKGLDAECKHISALKAALTAAGVRWEF